MQSVHTHTHTHKHTKKMTGLKKHANFEPNSELIAHREHDDAKISLHWLRQFR